MRCLEPEGDSGASEARASKKAHDCRPARNLHERSSIPRGRGRSVVSRARGTWPEYTALHTGDIWQLLFCSLPSDFPFEPPSVSYLVMSLSRSGSLPSDRDLSGGDPRKGWKTLEGERACTHPSGRYHQFCFQGKKCVCSQVKKTVFSKLAGHVNGRENRSLCRGGSYEEPTLSGGSEGGEAAGRSPS